MIIIPKNSPKQSTRKLKSNEFKYYQELEAEWRAQEPYLNIDEMILKLAKQETDRRLNRIFFRARIQSTESPANIALDDFQEVRLKVSSPRWESELKPKFYRKHYSYKKMINYWDKELQSERQIIEEANKCAIEQLKKQKACT